MKIFDLDHTVIDSSHRQLTKPCGALDLDHWRENCTRDLIFRDKLLPLARFMQDCNRRGETIAICTARVMSPHDYHFLQAHGLFTPVLMSRDGDTDRRSDADLKFDKLSALMSSDLTPDKSVIMLFDDNENVLTMAAERLKIQAIDSKPLNEVMRCRKP